MFIREKRISLNGYQEADIYPLTETADGPKSKKNKREKKKEMTKPAQSNFNDKRSRRFFEFSARNFGKGDYYLTTTFSEKYLPKTVEKAKYILKNTFIRKLRDLYKKAGKVLKYLYVMEYQEDEDGNMTERVHFHILISGGVNRDDIENCWSKGSGKNKEKMGRVNSRWIQPDGDGIKALVNYLAKKPRWKRGQKSWSGSRNLTKPTIWPKRDHLFSRRKIERYCRSNDLGYEELSKVYSDFFITEITPVYTDEKGWHMYLKMIRRE